MKVYVVMGNDYPDAVFVSQSVAAVYCKSKTEETRKEVGKKIYWRVYEFELNLQDK